ncbi:MAG: chemotaxis protein CheW [Pseudomonadota bacterium]
MPLADERLIVPRACVAEVVRYTRPTVESDAAEWILGQFSWNGRELPLISFEAMLGKPQPEMTGRTRVVVFHTTAERLKTRYFGLVTQGFPQLVRVNSEVLKLDDERGWSDDEPVICRVRMINEYPLIPDLEAIEKRIADSGRFV